MKIPVTTALNQAPYKEPMSCLDKPRLCAERYMTVGIVGGMDAECLTQEPTESEWIREKDRRSVVWHPSYVQKLTSSVPLVSPPGRISQHKM